MSLGFLGLSIGEAGEDTEELKTKYISWSGSNVAITPPATPSIGNINKLISGLVGGSKENGFAIENGFLEEFNWLSIINNTTQPVHVELWESPDDIVAYTKVGDLLTLPAAQTTVKMVTGLHLAIQRGWSYKVRVFTESGGTGTMSYWYSFILDYGTSPTMPTKYVNIGRQINQLSGFSPIFFQLNINLFTTASTTTRAPMPFNATISKIIMNKIKVPGAGTWNFIIQKNGVSVFTGGLPLIIEEQTLLPNVSFVKGDDIVFALTRTNTSLDAIISMGVAYESVS